MKTAVRETSVAAFYGKVIPMAKSQNDRVMAVIQPGKDYSLCELIALVPGIDKSSMSRVVNGLRAAGRLEPGMARKCTVTEITITPSRKPMAQKELFK